MTLGEGLGRFLPRFEDLTVEVTAHAFNYAEIDVTFAASFLSLLRPDVRSVEVLVAHEVRYTDKEWSTHKLVNVDVPKGGTTKTVVPFEVPVGFVSGTEDVFYSTAAVVDPNRKVFEGTEANNVAIRCDSGPAGD
jgi:hypothetical protein